MSTYINIPRVIDRADRNRERLGERGDPLLQMNQPPGGYVQEARDLLDDDAPWHHVHAVAWALHDAGEGDDR